MKLTKIGTKGLVKIFEPIGEKNFATEPYPAPFLIKYLFWKLVIFSKINSSCLDYIEVLLEKVRGAHSCSEIFIATI